MSQHEEKESYGPRLKELIKRHKVKQSELARASGVADISAKRWMEKDTWNKHTWIKIEKGLQKLRIDPTPVRPTTESQESTMQAEELIKIIDAFEVPGLLEALDKVLALDSQSIEMIRIICQDRIRRSKKK